MSGWNQLTTPLQGIAMSGHDGVYFVQPTEGGQAEIASQFTSIPSIVWGNVPMAQGFIKKLMTKHFGFIKTENDEDLFFHASSVQSGRFSDLREGQEVSYSEECGPRGPYAENVKPL